MAVSVGHRISNNQRPYGLPSTIFSQYDGGVLKSIAVLVLDDLSMFEFGVVCEVFGIDRTADGVPAFEFRVCGPEAGRALASTVSAQVVPQYGLDGLDGADLIAVPAARRAVHSPQVLQALRDAANRGATILSVCSGAFILGAAGLLDGRQCTTHWMHVHELREQFPAAEVNPDVLFVDAGAVITSAGTAAGIDACLYLVRRELGSAVANTIARRMVVPPQRNGGQRQYIERPVPQCSSDSLTGVLAFMVGNLEVAHTVSDLAARVHMSTRSFARRFAAETGTTPVQWLTAQRVLHAQRLLEDTTLDIDALANRCGFATAALLRHHFRRALGVTPSDYRCSFKAPSLMC